MKFQKKWEIISNFVAGESMYFIIFFYVVILYVNVFSELYRIFWLKSLLRNHSLKLKTQSKKENMIISVNLLFTIAFCENFFDSSIRFDCDIIFKAELF